MCSGTPNGRRLARARIRAGNDETRLEILHDVPIWNPYVVYKFIFSLTARPADTCFENEFRFYIKKINIADVSSYYYYLFLYNIYTYVSCVVLAPVLYRWIKVWLFVRAEREVIQVGGGGKLV